MRLRRSATALLVWSLLAFGAACASDGGGSSVPPTTQPAPPTTAEPAAGAGAGAAAVIEKAGDPPRRPLAFRVAAGTHSKLAVVNTVNLKLTIDGAAVPESATPATRIVLEHRIDQIGADAKIHYSVTFTDASVVATPGVDAAVARSLQASLNQIKGLRGTGTMDAQGLAKDFTVATGGISDEAVRSAIDSASSQVGSLAVTFPKEPVGVGGQWTVKRTATINGLVLDTTTYFTLRSRTGDRFELGVAQAAVAPPGPASIPNLPAGAQASLTDFRLQSSGTISGDVTRPLPVNSNVVALGQGTFTLTTGTERRTVLEQMHTVLTVSPA